MYRIFLVSILYISFLAAAEDPFLTALPTGYMPFEEFEKEFTLGTTSTEQLHPITKQLSQVMHSSIPKGMELLLQVDENVIKGLESFIPTITTLAPLIAGKISQGGRVFLVGGGSSGRVAIDIAAKCVAKYPKIKMQGVIAGGDAAFIRAKEGFEDSETEGAAALKEFYLGSNDTVILISASGSASFNVGCGHFAANKGATVFYFYNSKNIPLRTERLFKRNMIPICLDIGPQAIGGSTRLQGASLAESCLGALLGSALYLAHGEERLAKEFPKELAINMQKGIELIKSQLSSIEKFVQAEVAVFSNPRSNFRQVTDISNQGYVTFVSQEESIREVLIDSTETSPTFSTHPIRREDERDKKMAEFRAYLIGKGGNRKAWRALMGRDPSKEAEAFLLACEEEGLYSFSKRPKGSGNFLIGVARNSIPSQLVEVLEAAKKQGGSTGLIVLSKGELSEMVYDCTLNLENTPSDAFGFTETIILKQVLNLISNSSMILMNKVHGNQMIDMRPSNKKLIDRCMRLIKEICPGQPPDDKLLYHYVVHVNTLKNGYEEKGIYTPSVVKIVLAMLALKKTDFQSVIEFLAEKQERIDWIESDYLLCIEGGGSKTILQVMNPKGQILPLIKNGIKYDRIETTGSNINLIGPEGMRQVLSALLDQVFLPEGVALKSLLPHCRLIAGMAGAAQNRQSLVSLIQERGIPSDRILVLSDAEMALQLIQDKGIVLIAGTGSICLGKKGGTQYRVGGLGRILGDEGSGYQIGLQALKAALAEEYGWGAPTCLTPALKELFQVADLKTVIPQINRGEISPSKIASSAPIVFSLAAQDTVAKEIIDRAADDLSSLLTTMLQLSSLSDCEIHLWGGIFKNSQMEAKIREKLPKNLKMINQSKENPALLFAIQNLKN